MNSISEITGQIKRIAASIIFTKIWIPDGNTGGSNVPALKIFPIRKGLQKIF